MEEKTTIIIISTEIKEYEGKKVKKICRHGQLGSICQHVIQPICWHAGNLAPMNMYHWEFFTFTAENTVICKKERLAITLQERETDYCSPRGRDLPLFFMRERLIPVLKEGETDHCSARGRA